ncbi:Uncharacterised protein [[Eubacterium] infirmum]|nr:Uncharacterised protein [[Eubacterium] infirmum]
MMGSHAGVYMFNSNLDRLEFKGVMDSIQET